jgi:phospholipase/carboxylesterase
MMMQTAIQPLETLEIALSEQIDSSIIWLHGLGADGHDFASLMHDLGLPNTRFILPHAPHMPVTLNNGYMMRAWYDIFGLDSASQQDSQGIARAQLQIEALIAHEQQRGIRAERIVLAGFSQGGAIALHTGLRHPHRLGGLMALSAYLPLKAQLDKEVHEANRHLPVFVAHGSFDQVIALETGKAAARLLEQYGYEVTWREYVMAHSVCPEEIADIRIFLRGIFA